MAKDSDTVFKISGSALSFLFYECDKSRMDQVGFLIGEKNLYVRKLISDSEVNGERNEIVISINACLTVGVPFMFCNNVGRVDSTKLREILGPLEKDVCGWYSFRRNSGIAPTLRTTILHRELLNALPHVSPESFVLCCIGSDANGCRSTHRIRHIFYLHENRSFQSISVPIMNLGQPQDNGYRTVSHTNSASLSANDIINSLKLDKNTGGLTVMKALHKPLQERILKLAAQVQQYDHVAQKLENEIQEMKYNNLKNPLIEQYNMNNSNVTSPDGAGDKNCQLSEEDNDEDEDNDNGEENECDDGEEAQLMLEDESKENKGSEDSEEIICSSQQKTETFLNQKETLETTPCRSSLRISKNNTQSQDTNSQLLKFEQSPEY